MALSIQEKATRRRVLSKAVKELRQRLGWSQSGLAEKLHDNVVTISRWETETQAPGPSKRLKMKNLAERHGWDDLARLFQDTSPSWRAMLKVNLPAHHRAMTTLELIVLNAPDSTGAGPVPGELWQQMTTTAEEIIAAMLEADAAGDSVELLGEDQAALWLELKANHAARRSGQGTREGHRGKARK